VGEDYYLVRSSFEYAPGLPIYQSKDLLGWRQIGCVLDRPSQLAVAGAPASGGVYAPTLRYHDGRFYLITTNVSDRAGQLLVTAQDPAGPWSDPVWVPDALGIDPDLAWDAEGTESGHAVTVARGACATGPFEASPFNPFLTARSTDNPVQNTGHADLVQRPDGRWAMVYLGTRPRGYAPQWHVLGRETFAVRWPGTTAGRRRPSR
jgi:xylan 1,4-beta-xylosidase